MITLTDKAKAAYALVQEKDKLLSQAVRLNQRVTRMTTDYMAELQEISDQHMQIIKLIEQLDKSIESICGVET